MNKKEFFETLYAANWCNRICICIDDNGIKCPFYNEKRNCNEIFAKFIMEYEKEIRENTHFCEHCGSLIEKGDKDD